MENCCCKRDLLSKTDTSDSANTESSSSDQISIRKVRSDKSAKSIKKRSCQGWKFEWTTPKREDLNIIKAVVPGPFIRPKLVKALPYTLSSACNSCGSKHDQLRKLRNGIPDPWLEYLTCKESEEKEDTIALRDVRLCKEYLRLTNYVWDVKGLPMVQGIPDPWKGELYCECLNVMECNEKKLKKEAKKKKNLVEPYKVERDKETAVVIKPHKILKNIETKENLRKILDKTAVNLRSMNGFDKIKIELTEFDKQLKLKEAEKKRKVGEHEKKLKSRESKIKHKKCKTLQTFEVKKIEAGKEKSSEAVAKVKALKEELQKCIADQRKLKKEKEANFDSIHKKQDNKKQSSIPKATANKRGECTDGRFGWRAVKPENQKHVSFAYPTRNHACRSSPRVANLGLDKASLEKIVQDIDTRIKVTEDVMKSPDAKTDRVRCFDEESCAKRRAMKSAAGSLLDNELPGNDERKKGGGDIEIYMDFEVIDLRNKKEDTDYESSSRSSDSNVLRIDSERIFERSKNSLSRVETLETPDCDSAEIKRDSRCRKFSYQERSLRNLNNVTNLANEQLIVESISDTESNKSDN